MSLASLGNAFAAAHGCPIRNRSPIALGPFIRRRPLLFTVQSVSSSPGLVVTLSVMPARLPPINAVPPSTVSVTGRPVSVHLSDTILEERLCAILSDAATPLVTPSLGWAFCHQYGKSFRKSSGTSLESFLRQRPLLYTVFKDPLVPGSLVHLTSPPRPLIVPLPPSVPTSRAPASPPPPSYSIVVLEQMLNTIV